MAASTTRLQAAEPVRIETSRDVWISSFPAEREGNNGGSPKLKLKGIQEFFLIDFDPLPLRGRRVVRAQLHLHALGPETIGRATVSTVTEPWQEGAGSGYQVVPEAVSFAWAATGSRRWNDVDITGAINGLGGSIWGFADAFPRDGDDWQVIPIEPAVVQSRIDGTSHGFCVMDDVGSEYSRDGDSFTYKPFPNRFFSSREGGRRTAPFFTLWFGSGDTHASVGSVVGETPRLAPARLPAVPESGPSSSVPVRDMFGERLETLEFTAARGEAIGFMIDDDLQAATIDLPLKRFDTPRVGGHVDPLVPAEDGRFVELFVPKDARAGRHAGTLRIAGRDHTFGVTVWNFSIADRLSFVPQMNAYSLPDHERAFYRLAHEHRATLNWLPYNWNGSVKAAPRVDAAGTWDWVEWDARFGPLLDGTAFADLPRGPVPVDAFYLPLNENWPMDHERSFKGGYWIESAYDEDYWPAFRKAVEQFAGHLEKRGWDEPMFEFYLNNKVYFKKTRSGRWSGCSAAWIFDEPVNTQDFWALRRYGVEFWQALAAARPEARFVYRCDLSRPEWRRDLLDGVVTSEVINGSLRVYRDRVMRRARRLETLVSMYGSANPIGTSNVMPAAWCVEAWAIGADGVVPWQTIGTERSWSKPDELSLFYPTRDGAIPSIRLKCFRYGQQLVEYLTMYCAVSGESRDAVGAAVLSEPGLTASTRMSSDDDAGASAFGADAHRSVTRLRERLGAWLDSKAPAARERWHDPRPPPPADEFRREIAPLQPPRP